MLSTSVLLMLLQVLLIKLQKIVSAGADATRRLDMLLEKPAAPSSSGNPFLSTAKASLGSTMRLGQAHQPASSTPAGASAQAGIALALQADPAPWHTEGHAAAEGSPRAGGPHHPSPTSPTGMGRLSDGSDVQAAGWRMERHMLLARLSELEDKVKALSAAEASSLTAQALLSAERSDSAALHKEAKMLRQEQHEMAEQVHKATVEQQRMQAHVGSVNSRHKAEVASLQARLKEAEGTVIPGLKQKLLDAHGRTFQLELVSNMGGLAAVLRRPCWMPPLSSLEARRWGVLDESAWQACTAIAIQDASVRTTPCSHDLMHSPKDPPLV